MKYINITVTVFSERAARCNHANLYLTEWDTDWELVVPMPTKVGFEKLREYARKLGVKPQLEFNPFDSSIRSWSVNGFLKD